MPQHRVEFSIPRRPVGKADIEFQVWGDEEMLGTLRISYGALDWIPGRSPRSRPYRISWEKFDEFAREQGQRIRIGELE
jgi:hypothetical protein